MVKYELKVDYADNGALADSKCQTCRDSVRHVFIRDESSKASFNVMIDIETWHKERMTEHDLKHSQKVK